MLAHGRKRLLFSNPGHGQSGLRRDMTIRMSYDEGLTWPIQRLLWPGPAAYSSLAVLPEGDVACLFEGGRQHPYERILFTRFTRQWLISVQGEP